MEEERIALLQEKERLNDKIHEQNRQLSDLKHDYELACSEVKRLADEISAKVEDCHIGPWCDGCEHKMKAVMKNREIRYNGGWVNTIDEEEAVVYCGKHLHEMCPEFEKEHVPHWAV